MAVSKPFRTLAIDTSLGAPGIAVLEVKGGRVKLVAVSHIKTNSTDDYVLRAKTIESWAHLFIRAHLPFDVIVRESFSSKFERSNYPIFTAWAAIDRALKDFGLQVTEKSISPTSVKKRMTGKARKVTKEEVADGVRKYVGDFVFSKDDESDAAAIGLTWLIDNGKMKEAT